mgnify:CR=1 FL=1
MPLTLETTDVIPDVLPVSPREITCKGEFVFVPVVLACELLHSLPGLHFGMTIGQTHKSHDDTHRNKRETLAERDVVRPPGVHVCRLKKHDSSVEVGRNLFPHDYNIAPGGISSQEEFFHHESFTIKRQGRVNAQVTQRLLTLIQEWENGCEFSVQTLDKTGSDMLKF